jgi:hypothetical protein
MLDDDSSAGGQWPEASEAQVVCADGSRGDPAARFLPKTGRSVVPDLAWPTELFSETA